jgi:hypothetical protein
VPLAHSSLRSRAVTARRSWRLQALRTSTRKPRESAQNGFSPT